MLATTGTLHSQRIQGGLLADGGRPANMHQYIFECRLQAGRRSCSSARLRHRHDRLPRGNPSKLILKPFMPELQDVTVSLGLSP